MPEISSKNALQAVLAILVTLVLGMGGWGILRIVDQSEHIAKIDTTLGQQTDILKDNNKFARETAIALSSFNPEKMESSLAELRVRINQLQAQVTDQQREIARLAKDK